MADNIPRLAKIFTPNFLDLKLKNLYIIIVYYNIEFFIIFYLGCAYEDVFYIKLFILPNVSNAFAVRTKSINNHFYHAK